MEKLVCFGVVREIDTSDESREEISYIWLENTHLALIYTINHLLNSAGGDMTIVSTHLPHISQISSAIISS